MIRMSLGCWVSQSLNFALSIFLGCTVIDELLCVLMLGQTRLCSSGHVVLCAMWFVDFILCYNE